MSSADFISVNVLLLISLITIGSLRVTNAEEKPNKKNLVEQNEPKMLNQRISVDFLKPVSLEEIVSTLVNKFKINSNIHSSLAKKPDLQNKNFSIVANDILLKDFLYWVSTSLDIGYTILNDQIIFCNKTEQDLIDKTWIKKVFNVKSLLSVVNKDANKPSSLTVEDIKELIMAKVGWDAWDANLGTSIKISQSNIIITHNKAILNKIEDFLNEFKKQIEARKDANVIKVSTEAPEDKRIQAILNKHISINKKKSHQLKFFYS